MCLVCIEYEKGKLKVNEAFRNLDEMRESVGQDHYDEISAFLTSELLKEQLKKVEFGREIEDGLYDEECWEEIGFGD